MHQEWIQSFAPGPDYRADCLGRLSEQFSQTDERVGKTTRARLAVAAARWELAIDATAGSIVGDDHVTQPLSPSPAKC